MSSASYQLLPSDEHDEEQSPTRQRYIPEHIQLAQDARFNPPTPPWWKRALLILFIIFLFWLSYSLHASMQKGSQPNIVHAQRLVHSETFLSLPLLFVFRRIALTFYPEDIQRNTSIARRPALSFMRNSRMEGHACEVQLLPVDLFRLS